MFLSLQILEIKEFGVPVPYAMVSLHGLEGLGFGLYGLKLRVVNIGRFRVP